MPVDRAGRERTSVMAPLLLEELELRATANTGIIVIGRAVFHYLKNRGFQRPLDKVLHYFEAASRFSCSKGARLAHEPLNMADSL